MSQDQPKQPPTKTEPKTPAPKPKISQSESTLQKVGQTLRQAWSQAQPVLKAQSIKFLRATIRTLEGVLAKLEAPSKTISTKEIPTPAQPTATAEPSESEVAPVASSAPASGASDQPTPVFSPESMLDKLRPRLEQLQGWWNVALGKIRSWLPESLQKLSDTALTGAAAGILVILLWTTSALLPGKPPKVANVPPSQRDLPTTDLTTPPELSAPEKPQPVEVSPPPPEAVATPPPTPELSPEQQLIAEIQTQVTEIGNQYADRLIQSVQVIPGSRLIVKASNNWYSFSPSQQDKLAGELLNQAQKRDLGKLEITDFQGTLLARSPVVGGDMVILKRQRPSPAVAAS